MQCIKTTYNYFLLVLTLTICMLNIRVSHAQEKLNFNTIVDHIGLLNPSYTGKDTTVWIDAINTTQWSGFDGSPTTTTAYMHGHIQSIESVDRGEDVKKTLGFGFTIQSDKIGLRNNSTASIQLEAGVQLGSYTYLFFGLDGGSNLIRYDLGKMDAGVVTPVGDDRNEYFVGGGLTLEANYLTIGGSARRLISTNTETNNMVYYGHAEYMAMLPSFSLRPVGVVMYDVNKQLNWDAGLFAGFVRDKIWVGGVYHSNKSITGILRLHALKFFKLSYAYTLNTGELVNFAKNTHEFNVSIDIRNLWMKIFGIKHAVIIDDYLGDGDIGSQKNSIMNK
ncbi:PorP/SprF family type IX secretion system membrane protein [Halosquirtibacter xylanolyticus]|uniref:PorP/SprF family type IX secretion system membrane protein n=1 Tax=Halosquirtibacter xylanolyticus TaxID=3374599 RepID=UPI00374859BA|nr:PorP/SprF family type IX secretion system membrane protein [Prolixibacteraceae bacterium]